MESPTSRFPWRRAEHRVCVHWQSSLASRQQLSGAAELTAEAGKTYYFRTWILPSGLTGGHREGLWLKQVDSRRGCCCCPRPGKARGRKRSRVSAACGDSNSLADVYGIKIIFQ